MIQHEKTILAACWFFLPLVFVFLLLYVVQSVVVLAVGMAICNVFAFFTFQRMKVFWAMLLLTFSFFVAEFFFIKEYPCAYSDSGGESCFGSFIFSVFLLLCLLQMFVYGFFSNLKYKIGDRRELVLKVLKNIFLIVVLLVGLLEIMSVDSVFEIARFILYFCVCFLLFLITFRYTNNYLCKKYQTPLSSLFTFCCLLLFLSLVVYSQDSGPHDLPKEVYVFTVFYLGSLLMSAVFGAYFKYFLDTSIRKSN